MVILHLACVFHEAGLIRCKTAVVFIFLKKDCPKDGHIRFSIKTFFYNISETINWIYFCLLEQLHMFISHLACVFHDAGLIRCETVVLLIFTEIFRPLYLKNYKCDNIDFFYREPL